MQNVSKKIKITLLILVITGVVFISVLFSRWIPKSFYEIMPILDNSDVSATEKIERPLRVAIYPGGGGLLLRAGGRG